MKDNRSWTDQQIAELRYLWTTGLSGSKIGAQIGMSKCAVISKARRLRLKKRYASPDDPIITIPAGPPPNSQTVAFTEERNAVLRRDFAAGVSRVIIAERINALPGPELSPERVSIQACQLGLKRPRKFSVFTQAELIRRSVPVQTPPTPQTYPLDRPFSMLGGTLGLRGQSRAVVR